MVFGILEEQVAPDTPVRIVDAFVKKLQLQKLGFSHYVHK
jgi:hypothetical protein